MKNIIGIILLIVLSFHLQAQKQTTSILGHFTLSELNGKVLLNWQVIQGSTCNGIQIYRSVNNSNFVEVGEIVGVCGSSLEPINYNFTDNNPVPNQVNYYRLELGGAGNSEVLGIEIIDVKSIGFQIRPHPVTANSKLFFSNPKSKSHILIMYSITGKEVMQTETAESYFNLTSSLFQSGLYFFRIYSESNQLVTSGKLVVQ
jgi:hypothetical protein